MHPNSARFIVDPTPRRADGEYIAHARISVSREDGSQYDVHVSGDLAGFDARDDAIAYAKNWAQQWLDAMSADRAGGQPGCDQPGCGQPRVSIQSRAQRSE